MRQTAPHASCFCGSGRSLDRCHGLPRRERRLLRTQLEILAEANEIAALFPSVRPDDAVFSAYAEQVGAALASTGPAAPVEVVENGLRLLDDEERRRVVGRWALSYPDRWRRIIDLAGEPALVERAVVAGAVRVTLLENRPLPPEVLTPLEGGALRHLPTQALALLVAPPAVWSIDEAVTTLTLFPRRGGLDAAWFETVERHAASCVGTEHVARLRAACRRVARQFPMAGLPRASEIAAAGCSAILTDNVQAKSVCALLLTVYVASPMVASELRPRHHGRRA